ncbi:MAG: hypothetical protein A2Y77_00485 [Planctomycetes bacterium RBG_13_62_9]|nr:MAG: hypothetical protein A2Y77_00485 [Planctomycetes bacterium RBG_13_62_9]
MKPPIHTDENQSRRGRELRCPTCKRIVRYPRKSQSEQAKFFPFCSQRCKLIDLGAWLNAEYRIPSLPNDQADAPPKEDSRPAHDAS